MAHTLFIQYWNNMQPYFAKSARMSYMYSTIKYAYSVCLRLQCNKRHGFLLNKKRNKHKRVVI